MRRFIQEFKDFIMRGNVIDLAVGIIIGAAFTSVVTALIDNIVVPLINLATGGGANPEGLNITINGVVFGFGTFIGAVINFVLMALVVFIMVKVINNIRKKKISDRDCPYCKMKISKAATKCPYCTADVEPVAELRS
ncbi:MAG TPA: large conductance mechanosensitive channel protein MscL [Clostridiales bacterium]|nr:large conductance mechanosensitive channel protein MscL [Clostridiales bacterium]